ncbi:MAG: hypothetical protein WA323_04905 [Candidatus Nitrosopolaris sp.]|jgi:transitional endoplasmic reticulum ATPase
MESEARIRQIFKEALVSMQHIEEAVKKIRIQREMKPGEKITLSQYG